MLVKTINVLSELHDQNKFPDSIKKVQHNIPLHS